MSDLFDGIVGQADAVSQLRGALAAPVHAYLLVGPPGAGSARLADAFAGELLAAQDPEAAERHRRLAEHRAHPSVTIVERVGASILKEQIENVVRIAALKPVEGTRQIIVLTEFHLVGNRAPMLLKTIEEPPESTIFIVLADEVSPDLVTIASRCVTVSVPPLTQIDLVTALVADGVAPDIATAAAEASGGDLDLARLLAGDADLVERRAFWMGIPDRLAMSGSNLMGLVDEAVVHLDALAAPIALVQETEVARLEELIVQMGTGRTALKDLEARHNRERRRVRVAEINAGLSAIASRYRSGLGRDVTAAAYTRAGTAIARTSDRLQYNPRDELLLAGLFADLPGVS